MKGIKQFILVLSLVVPAIPGTAMSNLPLAVNGNELPSLAPMVERTRPAVVNIATRGKVDVQNHPLLNDPFFKRFFQGFGDVLTHRPSLGEPGDEVDGEVDAQTE